MSDSAVIDTVVSDAPDTNPAPAGPQASVASIPGDAPQANAPAPEPVKQAETPVSNPVESVTPAFLDSVPSDWRQQIAQALSGGDEAQMKKLQGRLDRFKTMQDYLKSTVELRSKVDELRAQQGKPGEGASEEELTAWREANGVPAKPEEYRLDLGEGVQLNQADQAVVDALLPAAHELGLSNEAMSRLGQAFFERRAQDVQAIQDRHNMDRANVEKTLRESWGPDYQRNINVARSILNEMPEGLQGKVLNAVGPDGRGIMNDPEFIQFLVGKQLQANPAVTLVPMGDSNPVQTLDGEIASIEKTMRDDPSAYWKDQSKQNRYRELLEAREKYARQN